MINRTLNIHKILKNNQSAFLFGPRGVGKTILARDFLQKEPLILQLDLLDNEIYRRYLLTPGQFKNEVQSRFKSGQVLTVLIDEVQKLPALLDEVHSLMNDSKGKVRFLLTGSSSRKLKRGGANLLAGRALTLKLHPFSFAEVSVDLNLVLSLGSLPAIFTEKDNDTCIRLLKAYVDSYLKEEIFQEALTRKTENFVRFLEVAAQVNSEPVNFTAIGKSSGVSTKTVQEYFSILTDTMIANPLYGWTRSVRKQLMVAPKYYFFDCGVLNAIRGELKTEIKSHSYRFGKLFETMVINEIFRFNDYLEADYRFHYWRTNTGTEVDIILFRNLGSPPLAIEIKSHSAPTDSDLVGLKAFKKENPLAKLYCFSTTPNRYFVSDISVLPWQEGIIEIFDLTPP